MDPLLTSDEIAAYLRVDVVTIRRLITRGELTAYRVGNEYRFKREDIERYLQEQLVGKGAPGPRAAAFEAVMEHFGKLFGKGKAVPIDGLVVSSLLTKRARKALWLAREEAQRLRHNYVGTEHLLLGLVCEGEGIAAKVLNEVGVNLDKSRRAIEYIIGRGNQVVVGEIGLTPRAAKVMTLAASEAERLHHQFIGTEHILLGLLEEGGGIGVGVIEGLKVNRDMVREKTLQAIQQVTGKADEQEGEQEGVDVPGEAAGLVAEGEKALTCAFCGARNPLYFHYCFNCGLRLDQEKQEGEEGS